MKKITVYQENNDPIIFYDDFPEDINFEQLFNYSKITKLETEDKSLLIRPSKINGILIENIQQQDNQKNINSEKTNETEENIITDGE